MKEAGKRLEETGMGVEGQHGVTGPSADMLRAHGGIIGKRVTGLDFCFQFINQSALFLCVAPIYNLQSSFLVIRL